jgi:hypothetical protein
VCSIHKWISFRTVILFLSIKTSHHLKFDRQQLVYSAIIFQDSLLLRKLQFRDLPKWADYMWWEEASNAFEGIQPTFKQVQSGIFFNNCCLEPTVRNNCWYISAWSRTQWLRQMNS